MQRISTMPLVGFDSGSQKSSIVLEELSASAIVNWVSKLDFLFFSFASPVRKEAGKSLEP